MSTSNNINIPKVGDVVYIESDKYTGDATVTYIDYSILYVHHQYPIQVEIDEGDLHKMDDFNCGQTMLRVNLKEIVAIQTPDNVVLDKEHNEIMVNQQGSLFDDF